MIICNLSPDIQKTIKQSYNQLILLFQYPDRI